MGDMITQVTVFCKFELTVDVPSDFNGSFEELEEWAREQVANDEMLTNCVDSGIKEWHY